MTGIFRIENFWNFPKWTFLEFPKLEIFGTFNMKNFWDFQNSNLSNFPNWQYSEQTKLENNKFLEFFNIENQNLVPKIGHFRIVCPFDIPHYSQFS